MSIRIAMERIGFPIEYVTGITFFIAVAIDTITCKVTILYCEFVSICFFHLGEDGKLVKSMVLNPVLNPKDSDVQCRMANPKCEL